MRRPGASERGVTFVEFIAAVTIISIGVLGLFAAMASAKASQAQSMETELATRAADAMVETMRTTPYEDIYPTYNLGQFSVPGWSPPDGFPSVGRIECFVDETAVPAELGGPRDLNFDNGGVPDDGDASGSDTVPVYVILPVEITVRWKTFSGAPREMKFYYLLRDDE